MQQQCQPPDRELITVGLTRPAMAAMERAMRITGDSRNDVVNLAVIGYTAMIAAIQAHPGGEPEPVPSSTA